MVSLDHREDAIDVILEAVELRRQLARECSAVYDTDLVVSLDGLCNRLSKLGRREDDLDAILEAVKLYWQLVKEYPSCTIPVSRSPSTASLITCHYLIAKKTPLTLS
jgi:hypothetical protein